MTGQREAVCYAWATEAEWCEVMCGVRREVVGRGNMVALSEARGGVWQVWFFGGSFVFLWCRFGFSGGG